MIVRFDTKLACRLALGTIILSAIVVRLIHLGRESLWADELFSVVYAEHGISFILHRVHQETNPPLYYLFQHFWIAAFGDSEASVRFPSVIWSVATVPVLYALGRNLFGRHAGLLAALLFALSTFNLGFDQEARSYPLLSLDIALLLLCTERALISLRDTGRLPSGWCCGMIVFASLGLYIHYISIFILLSLAISLLLIVPANDWRRYLRAAGLIGFGVIALGSPMLYLATSLDRSVNISWIAPPNLGLVIALAMTSATWTLPFQVLSVMTFPLKFVLFAWGAYRWRGRGYQWVIPYAFPIVGICTLFAVSMYRPVLMLRTELWSSVPIYLGLAGAVMSLPRFRRPIILALIALYLVYDVGYVAYHTRQPWRETVASITQKAAPDDIVVVGEGPAVLAFWHYGTLRNVERIAKPESDGWYFDLVPTLPVVDPNTTRKVWYVTSACDVPPGVPHDATTIFVNDCGYVPAFRVWFERHLFHVPMWLKH